MTDHINVTANEIKVLEALHNNHYGNAGDCTWSWAVNQSKKPSGLEGKTLSGVVASICKKGWYTADGEALWQTAKGKEVMSDLFEH